MTDIMIEILKNCSKDTLLKGCILASIAHAIMVRDYPMFSYEQSWDGINYSIQDGAGSRGTITFETDYCVAAFRNENSSRMFNNTECAAYYPSVPMQVIETAEKETLQYLLYDNNKNILPCITSFFWGDKVFYSIDSEKELFANGGELIKRQLLCINVAENKWTEYYGFNQQQKNLLKNLYQKRILSPFSKMVLSKEEMAVLNILDDEGSYECMESFKEIQIFFK